MTPNEDLPAAVALPLSVRVESDLRSMFDRVAWTIVVAVSHVDGTGGLVRNVGGAPPSITLDEFHTLYTSALVYVSRYAYVYRRCAVFASTTRTGRTGYAEPAAIGSDSPRQAEEPVHHYHL